MAKTALACLRMLTRCKNRIDKKPMMSVLNVDELRPCDCDGGCGNVDDGGCHNVDASTCRRLCPPTAAQSFDLVDELCRGRRTAFYHADQEDNDDVEEDCDCAVWSEYSEDYTSMTGSSSTTPLSGNIDDRIATLSISSRDSFSLDDLDDDRLSISTLENEDDENPNITSELERSLHASPWLTCSSQNSCVTEDLEFNFLTTSASTPVRRSASLKSSYGETPPCSPRVKKAVRFADALGLDLESIRHILDASDAPPTSLGLVPSGSRRHVQLIARFSEPGASVNFLRRVQERKVSLEEVSIDTERMSVSGVIRVANIAYQKLVTVRYTVDNWETYRDHAGVYLPPGSANKRYDGGLTDAFTFQLMLAQDMGAGRRLEFSVRFVAGADLTFWDSNFGANYVVDCVS